MSMSDPADMVGVVEDYHATAEGLVRTSEQELPGTYWEGLQWAREQDAKNRCPELWRVASVPAIFVEAWMRDGFNIWEETAEAVVKRLRENDLSEFCTTRKSV